MNNQEQVWKVGKWVGLLLVIFLAIFSLKELLSISYIGKDLSLVTSISVTGEGEAVSIPDIATFSFSVTETAKTVKEAQDKAIEKTNIALKAIKDGGVAEKDIKTLSYSINPRYEYGQTVCNQYGCPPSKSILIGYDVSQTIQVKVRDLSKAGNLFDTIGSAGIQTVNGLAFSIDDTENLKSIARANAIAKAKIKAQKIASDLGVNLVRVTNFYDSNGEVPPIYTREGMSSNVMTLKASVSPQIPTGEQKIISNVTITYEIR